MSQNVPRGGPKQVAPTAGLRAALGEHVRPRTYFGVGFGGGPAAPPTSQQVHVESPHLHLHRHGRRSNRGQALVLAGRLGSWYTVNYMVQYARTQLDASLAALSDSTRAVSSSSSAVRRPRSRTWPNGST